MPSPFLFPVRHAGRRRHIWRAATACLTLILALLGPIHAVYAIGSALAFTNLDGDSVDWAGAGNTVMLDADSAAAAVDPDCEALNSGDGDWDGATLIIQRLSAGVADGGANHLFTFLDSSLFSLQEGNAFSDYPTQSIQAAFAAGQNATGALNDDTHTGWFARYVYRSPVATILVRVS